ncbi:MAG TPA: SH3 domain-containing protein [Gemmatimonadota bacterium]|jgi:SH3-like domain-containing protein
MSPEGSPPRIVHVVRAYRTQYPDPIRVRAGERVRVGREEEDYPGWRWCVAPDGREGWVPVDVLQQEDGEAILRIDYEATELDVNPGQQVTVEKELRAWLWVEDAAGARGWIPASHVAGERSPSADPGCAPGASRTPSGSSGPHES